MLPVTTQSPPLDGTHARSRPLRRLTLELFVVIALKIALLMLLWWLLFAPQPRPDVSPAAISRLLAPSPSAAPVGRP
ncbi:MAG: cytochrome oxidase putative small subunit CydP [Rhodanobacter sp.]